MKRSSNLGLYDYQLDAINRLKNGNILCGGVGSGKSRTALGYYFKEQGGIFYPYSSMKNPKDLYIITTARKRDTKEWDGDMVPFLMSSNPKQNQYSNKIIVDSWNNIKKYVDITNAFFIFDEQRVVGYGVWTKSFLKITKSNDWLLLTATPGDSWSDYIPVFIANGFYKNKTEFLRTHAVYSYYTKYPKIVKYINQGRLVKYRNEILVKMSFERKTIKHNENVLVEYDRLKYNKIYKDRWDIYANEPIENISKLCYLLRKVVNSDESRINAVKQLCAVHKKAIIFYNYDYELEILKNIDYEAGTVIAEWNGHDHEAIPNSERWVYLVQYAAGAEGWNCVQTDTIIFYSMNYSYKTMVQASGRIDRLNTPFTDLFYYHLRSNSSIDVAIAACLKKKQNFNENIFVF